MKRLFITTLLPEKIIAKHGVSFAACNFSSNLISGGGFDKVYSTMPLFVGGELEGDAYVDPRFELVYDALRTKGGVWQKLAAFKEQWILFRKIPRDASVWFYNLYVLNFLTVILLMLFKRSVQINIIVLDFTPPTSKFSMTSLFLWLINRSNGVIKLADSPLFTNSNSVCLPGVTPAGSEMAPLVENLKPTFLLSGELQPDISSLPMVLEAFARVPDCVIHITGRAEYKEQVEEYSRKYRNIIFHDSMRFADYLNLLHSVTFQLSLRNPDWADNQCNFPSKIIEALLHNRGIISTISYNQLEGLEYITTERSVDCFVDTIRRISVMCAEDISQYVNQGSIVADRFSAFVWNEWMSKIENKKI